MNGHLNNRTVLVAGVPGVGKSSLIAAHIAARSGDVAVTGSTVVKQVLAPLSVADLDAMSLEDRSRVREEAVRRLRQLRLTCSGHLLVDGHLTFRNRVTGEIEQCFTESDRRFYDTLVLVDAGPTFVAALRAQDHRDRGRESVESIADHLERERDLAAAIACREGMAFVVVRETALSERVRQMREFLHALASGVAS